MIIVYTIIALLTLGGSTNGIDTNASIYVFITTLNSISGTVLGWCLIAGVVGLVLGTLLTATGHVEIGAISLGCLVYVSLAIFIGSFIVWLFSSGMVANFSPVSGPTSAVFWIWALLTVSLGMS